MTMRPLQDRVLTRRVEPAAPSSGEFLTSAQTAIGETMTTDHKAGDCHTVAASHHLEAMQYHRAAARLYEAGTDHGQMALQAVLAHGHARLALEQSKAAKGCYASSEVEAAETRLKALRLKSAVGAKPDRAVLTDAQHHEAAADRHARALGHHRKAAALCAAADYASAAGEASVAYESARRSVFHGNEAAKYHVEHGGSSTQIAKSA